jgi:hypothetical protein
MTGSAKPITFRCAMLAQRRTIGETSSAAAAFFFTANPAERRLRLLVDTIDLLRQAFRYVRRRHPFDIDAFLRDQLPWRRSRTSLLAALAAARA